MRERGEKQKKRPGERSNQEIQYPGVPTQVVDELFGIHLMHR